MAKYYLELGWYTPQQLSQISLEIANTDSGMATLLSDLAVIRNVGNPELEAELNEVINKFMRDKVPGFDTLNKRIKSQWN